MIAATGTQPAAVAALQADLEWWLQTAPTLKWRQASSPAYASIPHSYVVRDGPPARPAPAASTLPPDDFDRAVRLIHALGSPGKFHNQTNIYLHSPRFPPLRFAHPGHAIPDDFIDQPVKWWASGYPVKTNGVINMSTASLNYGPQTAPQTSRPNAPLSLYDALGPDYDQGPQYPSPAERAALLRLITGHFGAYAPSILDVGCGTGSPLDVRATSPALYTGIDPSRAMLNELVVKHPTVAALIPATAEDALPDLLALGQPRFDLVAATFGSASYLDEQTIFDLPSLARSLVILMAYRPRYFPAHHGTADPLRAGHLLARAAQARDAIAALRKEFPHAVHAIGDCETTVLRVAAP